jgi:hypothetical protein
MLAREVAKDQLIAIAYGHTAQLAATTLIEKTAIFCYSVPLATKMVTTCAWTDTICCSFCYRCVAARRPST